MRPARPLPGRLGVSPAPAVVQAELQPHPQHLLPTAFTPESCWPAMRTMMEMTCHRRDLILKSFSTEMKPAAFSALSSSRISSISASTSCQPRSLLRAGGREQRVSRGLDHGAPPTALPERMLELQSLFLIKGKPHRFWQLLHLSSESAGTWGSRGRRAGRGAAARRGSRSIRGGWASLRGNQCDLRAGSSAPDPALAPACLCLRPDGALLAALAFYPDWLPLGLEHSSSEGGDGDKIFVFLIPVSANP